eukprot:5740063-Pleurochrysis_carterae.AAC.3
MANKAGGEENDWITTREYVSVRLHERAPTSDPTCGKAAILVANHCERESPCIKVHACACAYGPLRVHERDCTGEIARERKPPVQMERERARRAWARARLRARGRATSWRGQA